MNTAGAWPGTMAAIAIGAVLGAWARWGLGLWLNRPDAAVPGGTLTANLIGGLLIGMFLALADRRPVRSDLQLRPHQRHLAKRCLGQRGADAGQCGRSGLSQLSVDGQ